MGHYYSEMRGPETELERLQPRAKGWAKRLRSLPASRFTVDELALLLRVDWSEWKHDYYEHECRELETLAAREGVADESEV
jgi:hypothetical protein